MSPREHVIYGGMGAITVYPSAGLWGSLFFWAASVLIDIDHYLDYVFHNGLRDFSFSRMFDYHNLLDGFLRRPDFIILEVFHTAEFLIPFYAAAALLSCPLMLAAFWGFIFHMALDIVYLNRNRILFIRAYSIIEYYIRKRSLKAKGYLPEEILRSAARMAVEEK